MVHSLLVLHDRYVFVRETAHGIVLDRSSCVLVVCIDDFDVESNGVRGWYVGTTQAQLVLQDQHRALAPVATLRVLPLRSFGEIQFFRRDGCIPRGYRSKAVDPGATNAAEVKHFGLGYVPAAVGVLVQAR